MAIAMPTSLLAADYVPRIITGVVKADSWTEATAAADIYQLEIKDEPTLTQLSQGNDVYAAPLGGAVYADGEMHGIHFNWSRKKGIFVVRSGEPGHSAKTRRIIVK